MMTEKNVRRFITELEEIHRLHLSTPPSQDSLTFYGQLEAKSKLVVLYAVLEETMPEYVCTRIRS